MQILQQLGATQRRVAGLALLTLVYLCADLALNKFAIGLGWTILWPLNGVTIALLLRTHRRRWLSLLLAIELGTMMGELLDDHPLGAELMDRAWSTLEVLMSAWLLPAFVSMEDWLAQPRIVRRVCGALVLAPAISGVLYAVEVHLLNGAPLVAGWNWWATPDMLGNAVTLPLALACFAPETRNLLSRAYRVNTLLLLTASAVLAALIFTEEAYPLLFLLYPLLLYVDSRLSFAGASIAMFSSTVIGVFCTVHGHGPFGHWAQTLLLPRDTALQLYLGFHALALLPLSLVILERRNIAAQLRRANAQLVALSLQDSLTGIANRRAFDESFAEAWTRGVAEGTRLSLLMIDIDNFKEYNDLYGHVMGDRCLAQVADVLARVLHAPNTVARFGGEEFVVLMPDDQVGNCYREAESLRRAVVSAGIPHDGNAWGLVTISIGCASSAPTLDTQQLELLERADAVLYRAKQRGRNRYECAVGAFRDEHDLRHASVELQAALRPIPAL